jgi:hypothetical protein
MKDAAELIAELRAGVRTSHYGSFRLYEIEAAQTAMAEAADRIERLEAENARLTKERDEARSQRDDLGRAWDQADARAIAAEARVATLSKALEPFARACSIHFNDWCPDETPAWFVDDEDGEPGWEKPASVTVGHFRAAREASR